MTRISWSDIGIPEGPGRNRAIARMTAETVFGAFVVIGLVGALCFLTVILAAWVGVL